MQEFDVRAASEIVPASALSGGNQQKQYRSKSVKSWSPNRQPTYSWSGSVPLWYIHKRLIQERDNGKAVLVVSFELDEF